jgi:predicted dehydrogenase
MPALTSVARMRQLYHHVCPAASDASSEVVQHSCAGQRVPHPQRWGVMGTAGIADVVLPAIAAAPGATVLACASRSLDKAAAWAAERGIARAYGSYQELLDDAEVDIVYIPLPTVLHIEWVLKAASAGKHILVEKPAGLSLEDVQRMVDACRAHSVQIMDAVHWMHNPRTPKFMSAIRSEIGPIRRINASFCFPAHRRAGFFEENIRTQADADPLGALGDLGWYTVRGILVAMDWALPTTVIALGRTLENGVPLALGATLLYPECVATMDCGFDVENREVLEVSGTDGTVRVDGFVLTTTPPHATPTKTTAEGNAFTVSVGLDRTIDGLPSGTRETSYAVNEARGTPLPLSQEAEMVQRMSEIVSSGRLQGCWEDYMLKTQRVVDALLKSLRQGGQPIAP